MENLSKRMNRISLLSKDLCDAFGKHRSNVSQLAEANRTVKNLQYILSLPQKLRIFYEQKDYNEAVKAYLAAEPTLIRYNNVPSIANIHDECSQLMGNVKERLKVVIKDSLFSSEELVEAITLLLKLDSSSTPVYFLFIENCRRNLKEQVISLRDRNKHALEEDVLEFVDDACSRFLADLSLVSALNHRLFPDQSHNSEMTEMVDSLMLEFEEAVRSRFFYETDARECAIVVRALDRFYRRVSSCNQIIGVDYSSISVCMLNTIARHEITLARSRVVEQVEKTVLEIRKELSSSTYFSHSSGSHLSELVIKLEQTLLVQLKTALASLLLFTASDMTFSSLDPALFLLGFGIDVHEHLVIGALEDIDALGKRFYEHESNKANVVPTVIIILAQFFMNIGNHSVRYILDLCREQFRLVSEREKNNSKLTPFEKIHLAVKTTAHGLLKYYVYFQGVSMSQLLVRSVDSRDWLKCVEPTTVRSAIKHFIDNLTSLSSLIKPFMDEGTRKERSMEVARSHVRRNLNYDSCSISSTLDKLWADRVDFSANIEFNRTSVLTALANVVLKSFLEVIRLQTFSKYGLQQIQVDCYYLQQNLWQFISDEHTTVSLLDEILSSAMHRSVDSLLMDLSLVKAIFL